VKEKYGSANTDNLFGKTIIAGTRKEGTSAIAVDAHATASVG
jgi:hypothetical protein